MNPRESSNDEQQRQHADDDENDPMEVEQSTETELLDQQSPQQDEEMADVVDATTPAMTTDPSSPDQTKPSSNDDDDDATPPKEEHPNEKDDSKHSPLVSKDGAAGRSAATPTTPPEEEQDSLTNNTQDGELKSSASKKERADSMTTTQVDDETTSSPLASEATIAPPEEAKSNEQDDDMVVESGRSATPPPGRRRRRPSASCSLQNLTPAAGGGGSNSVKKGQHQEVEHVEDETTDPSQSRRLDNPPTARNKITVRKGNKKKVASTTPASQGLQGYSALRQWMDYAEYEVYQDPYRGIPFPQTQPATATGNGKQDDDDQHGDSQQSHMDEMMSSHLPQSMTLLSPWQECCSVTAARSTEKEVVIDELHAFGMVQHITQCSCPSLQAWTRQRLDAEAKEEEKQAKKRKQQAQKRKKQQQKLPRSILGLTKQNNGTRKRSFGAAVAAANAPIDLVCDRPSEGGTSRRDEKADEDDETVQESTPAAPIGRLGQRPTDCADYSCPCDYNPWCLVSLGGLVDEILQERAKNTFAALTTAGERTGEHYDPIPRKRPKRAPDELDWREDQNNKRPQKNRSSLASIAEDREFDFISMDNNKSDYSSELVETPTSQKAAVIPLDEAAALPVGDPKEIFNANNPVLDDQTDILKSIQYSKSTDDALAKLRKRLVIPEKRIRSHVYRTLQIPQYSTALATNQEKSDNGSTSIDMSQYMDILKQWHRSLLFDNPTTEESHVPSDEIALSLPPGIVNLGATCYLNTQLQCLAQNLAFMNGIFSWKPAAMDEGKPNGDGTKEGAVAANDSTVQTGMNSVMSKLQALLANMLLGGDGTLSTSEFSSALGLDSFEQQDPNEFARLLFERMEESFQQCGDEGLANLLHRIFRGVSTYETVCMTCKAVSERNEEFMDWNVPIVKAPKQKGSIADTIREAFARSKNVDTNLQHCFQQNMIPERMEGENQYFCSICNMKRDATRTLKFTSLPPVLNVQLSRYVFDRVKCVKKKLSDKVLLPTSLDVPKSDGTRKTYLLCAVMKHLGTTAYSGHYIAEAMDWLTGNWFEFNDEHVKILAEGPSNSYVPSDLDNPKTDGKSGEADVVGSQDAYNMYYVDSSYLARNAGEAVIRRGHLCPGHQDELKIQKHEVLLKVTESRKRSHETLAEMCFADGRVSDRLRRRKLYLSKYVVPSVETLVPRSVSTPDLCWVDGHFLRKYLLCDRSMDVDLQASTCGMVDAVSWKCSHGNFHPRTAHKGKLLSSRAFENLASVVRHERAMLQSTDSDPPNGEKTTDNTVFVPISCDSDHFCPECSSSYREGLTQKLKMTRNMLALFDATAQLKGNHALHFDEGEEVGNEDTHYAYVLSKRSTTKFRNSLSSFVKAFVDVDKGIDIKSSNMMSRGLAGFDHVDLPQLVFCEGESETNSYAVDTQFNGNITCSHGNCNEMANGRKVWFVSYAVWQILLAAFPDTTPHRRPKLRNSDTEDNVPIPRCLECQEEKESLEKLRSDLKEWARNIRNTLELKPLLEIKRTQEEIQVCNFNFARSSCRLVHKSDIRTWRKAVNSLGTSNKYSASDHAQLREHAARIAFPNHHSTVLEFESEPIERLLSSMTSLICTEHQLVIRSALWNDNDTASTSHALPDWIVVVTEQEYNLYIPSLIDLLRILYVKEDRDPMFQQTSDMKNFTSSCHPALINHSDSDETKDTVRFSLDGNSKEFSLSHGVCCQETCRGEFIPLKNSENLDEKQTCIEEISIDSTGPSKKPTTRPTHGNLEAKPILVESDLEDDPETSMPLSTVKTFEVLQTRTVEEAIQTLRNQSATKRKEGSEQDGQLWYVRRSSRTRQSRYPLGALASESSVKVGMHHNVAALRLRLYETCEVPVSGNGLHVLLSTETSEILGQVEVLPSWGLKTLEEVLKMIAPDMPFDKACFDLSKQATFLFQNSLSSTDDTATMESLLELANLEEPEPQGSKARRQKRKRASERGFQGTLLHGAAPPSKPNAATDTDEDKTVIETSPTKTSNAIEDNGEVQPSIVDAPQRPIANQTEVQTISEASDEEADEGIYHIASLPVVITEVSCPNDVIPETDDESSASVISLLRPVFSPKPKYRHSRPNQEPNSSRANGDVIMCDDTSDEEDRKHEPMSRNDKDTEVVDVEYDPPPTKEQTRRDLQSKRARRDIFDKLKCSLNHPIDEQQCWTAVDFAIGSNEGEDVSGLVDMAMAKYFQLTDIG